MPRAKKPSTPQDTSNFGGMLADLGAALTSFGVQLSQIGARYANVRVSPSSAAVSGASPPRTVTLTASPAFSSTLNEIVSMPPKKTADDTKEKRAKRQKKDTNAPKRPLSGYLLFCMDNRPAIQTTNPSLAAVDVVRKLGEMWEKANEKEKEPYLEKAKELAKEAEKAKQEQAATASIGESSRDSIAISEEGGAATSTVGAMGTAGSSRKKAKVLSPDTVVDELPAFTSIPAAQAPASSIASATAFPVAVPQSLSQQASFSKEASESEKSKEARKKEKRERKEQREMAQLQQQTQGHAMAKAMITDSEKKRV